MGQVVRMGVKCEEHKGERAADRRPAIIEALAAALRAPGGSVCAGRGPPPRAGPGNRRGVTSLPITDGGGLP